MKKILALLLAVSMITCVFAGCGKEEEPEITGGWTDEATSDIPEDAQEAFDAAMETYTDMELTVTEYLGSQVVAGTNFKYTCIDEATGDEYTVVVYRDLEDNCSVTETEKN